MELSTATPITSYMWLWCFDRLAYQGPFVVLHTSRFSPPSQNSNPELQMCVTTPDYSDEITNVLAIKNRPIIQCKE